MRYIKKYPNYPHPLQKHILGSILCSEITEHVKMHYDRAALQNACKSFQVFRVSLELVFTLVH